MGLYTNWNYQDPHHQPAQSDVHSWPHTVGGSIMNAPNVDATTKPGMRAILAAFQTTGWTWNPKRGGRGEGAGKALLDRDQAGQGECGWLGWALHILLETPAPYGFGRAGLSTPRVYSGRDTWDGPNQEGSGFVATHVGVHFGRPANVSDYGPLSPMVGLSDLYKWGDHVVVEYAVNGRTYFWDPSYNTKYNNITDMAVYRIQSEEHCVSATGELGMHLHLTNGNWLRMRFPSEVNYNPHTVYLGPEGQKIPVPARPSANRTCIIL